MSKSGFEAFNLQFLYLQSRFLRRDFDFSVLLHPPVRGSESAEDGFECGHEAHALTQRVLPG